MKDLKNIIGSKILYIRTENNLSQKEFAEKLKLNISRGHISKIENGLNMPSAELIRTICLTFNVSPNWLLNMPKDISNVNDPVIVKYNKLNDESKKIINDLIRILLSNT
jgi:transcriptional regulator with XRE-family HTH domain